jgi:hypothetical protein
VARTYLRKSKLINRNSSSAGGRYRSVMGGFLPFCGRAGALGVWLGMDAA